MEDNLNRLFQLGIFAPLVADNLPLWDDPIMPRTLLLTLFALLAISALLAQAQTPVSVAPNSWSTGTPMPTARKGPFTGAIGTKIYVVGGETNSAVLSVNEIYDTTTNTWSSGAPMPTARWLGASAVVNNVFYAIGGGDAPGAAFSVVEAYDPATDTWSTMAPMPILNDNIYAAVEDNIVYVIGGFNPASGRLATALAYDPASNIWSTLAPLKVGKSESAVGLVGSTIIAAGGLTASGVTADNEGYNAATNSWEALAPVPTAGQAGCFGESGGLFYLAGGQNASQPLTVAQAYSVQTNTWATGLAPMPFATVTPGSAMVGGRLYCLGGADTGAQLKGNIFNYVQIYQPTLPPPSIGGVVSASAFGEFATAAPGSWIEIYGSNLASETRGWTGADFTGINAPTSLSGVSVTAGGQAAFIDYISPGQVNALIPSNAPAGVQQIVLSVAGVPSAPVNITINAVAPGLLAPPNFSVDGVQYAVAQFGDGTYVLPTGAISGLTSRPAVPGDIIVIYGVGFGPVTPDIPAGQLVGEANSLATDFHIFIGGMECGVQYDGLAPSYTGLYQFNIVVPTVASGNAPLTFTVDGVNGAQTLYIAIGQ